MIPRKIKSRALILITISIIFATSSDALAVDCSENCDWPWPAECAEYCAKQKIALKTRSFSNALLYIAWRKGFFKETGITTNMAYYGNSPRVVNNIYLFKDGKPIFGFVSTITALKYMEQKVPIKNIIAIENTPPLVLVGKKKISNIKELKGKNIGFPAHWPFGHAVNEALGKSGVKAHFFEMLDAPAVTTEIGGKIDYGVVSVMNQFLLQKYGVVAAMPIPKIIPDFLFSTIIINEKEKNLNYKEFIKFSKAVLKAVDFFYKNKWETIGIVQKELAGKGWDKKNLEIIYDFYKSNNIFKKDGIITPKAFEPLSVKLKFRDANDLSYIKAAK